MSLTQRRMTFSYAKPPLFVAEGLDISAFRDATALELKLEAIDVEAGIYEGWDAEGRVLQFTVESRRLGLLSVKVELKEPATVNSDGLRQRLAFVLAGYGKPPTLEMSLAEVVQQFVDCAGYTR